MVVHYVVLSYVHATTALKGREIIAVACPFTPLKDDHLRLFTANEWVQDVDMGDLEYVVEVIDDLQSKTMDEMRGIFTLLCHMSSGCLRTTRQGYCEEDDIEKVIGGPIF